MHLPQEQTPQGTCGFDSHQAHQFHARVGEFWHIRQSEGLVFVGSNPTARTNMFAWVDKPVRRWSRL